VVLRHTGKYVSFTPIRKVKGKAIPLQAWTGLEGSRRLRLPDFKTVGTLMWQGCQPYAPHATDYEIYMENNSVVIFKIFD
jgi:hypothetical protein